MRSLRQALWTINYTYFPFLWGWPLMWLTRSWKYIGLFFLGLGRLTFERPWGGLASFLILSYACWCFRLFFGSINPARRRRVSLIQTGQLSQVVWFKITAELRLVLIGIRQLGVNPSAGWWIFFTLRATCEVCQEVQGRGVPGLPQKMTVGLWSWLGQASHIPE